MFWPQAPEVEKAGVTGAALGEPIAVTDHPATQLIAVRSSQLGTRQLY